MESKKTQGRVTEFDSIEDLLKLAEDESIPVETTRTITPRGEVLRFIVDNDISPDDVHVPMDAIYDFYHQNQPNHITYIQFKKAWEGFFQTFKYQGITVSKINPASVGLGGDYRFTNDTRYFPKLHKTRNPYKGVYNIADRFMCRITLEDGKRYYLGNRKTAEEAARLYDVNHYYHFGSESDLNFPENIREYEKEIKEIFKR